MIGQLKDIRLELDGVDLKTDVYNFTLSGLFDNNFEHYDSQLYNDGGFVNGFKVQSRQLVLNGYVKTNKPMDILNINRLLSSKKKKLLKVEVDGLGVLTTEVVPTSFMTDEIGKKSCQLVAYDPYLYGENQILELGKSIYEGLKMPFRFPFKINGTDFANFNILNNGTEILYPKITVKGPCSNFEVKNVTTGKSMYFNLPLDQYDTLVIDNNPSTRGVKLNGYNVISQKIGDWLECSVGDNIMSFGYQSNSIDKLVTVEYRERFL